MQAANDKAAWLCKSQKLKGETMTKKGRYRIQGDVSEDAYISYKRAHAKYNDVVSDAIVKGNADDYKFSPSSGDFLVELLDYYIKGHKDFQ